MDAAKRSQQPGMGVVALNPTLSGTGAEASRDIETGLEVPYRCEQVLKLIYPHRQSTLPGPAPGYGDARAPVLRPVLSAFLIALSLATALPGAQAETARSIYKFGVFPHYAVARMERIYAPVAAEFSRALNRKVIFRTKSTFARFARELDRETYDIALIQPFDYVPAHDKRGYLPLVRRGEPLSAVIMVLPDSPLQKLEDLRGKTIALPPPVAAVSRLTKMTLLDAGLTPGIDVLLQHQRSHDSCLQQVLIGNVSACATAANPVRFFEAKMKVRFRLLSKTHAIPHVLFVVHPRVPPQERQRIKDNILSWEKTESGQRILETGKFTPFVPVSDRDYDVVRRYIRRVNAE